MQIKTPNSPKTKYSIKVLKSQSINSNYLSQLEACFALSATNKLCLTVWWLFQSGYKGERYFGAAHLEGVLVNVFYFQTLLFLSKLLQTWTSGKAWLIWSWSWFVIQILLVGRTSADLFPVLPLAAPVQPLVSTEQSRRSVWDQSCQVPWRSATWEVGDHSILGGGERKRRHEKAALGRGVKNQAWHVSWHSEVFFRHLTSTGEWPKLWDLDKLILVTGYSKAVKLKDKFELTLKINVSTTRSGNWNL